jgi:hypothetical protein
MTFRKVRYGIKIRPGSSGIWAKRPFSGISTSQKDQHQDMQRRIVDRRPKTLFPFGAPGEGPRGEVHGQSRGVDPWGGPIAYRPIFMCAT